MAKQTPTKEDLYLLFPRVSKDVISIIHQYIGNPFIITFNIQYKNYTITIPLIQSSANFFIDWGDDTCDCRHGHQQNITHNYKYWGNYNVHIYGNITNISFAHISELVDISQWGNLQLNSGNGVFKYCKYLSVSAKDIPNFENARDISYMFDNCITLRGDFSKWNVSNITNIAGLFAKCVLFNSDLSEWNMENVTNMSDMFYGCEVFQSDLSNWNVSNVTEMLYTFNGCFSFDSDLSRWDIKKVRRMYGIFSKCHNLKFDINNWNFSDTVDKYQLYKSILGMYN